MKNDEEKKECKEDEDEEDEGKEKEKEKESIHSIEVIKYFIVCMALRNWVKGWLTEEGKGSKPEKGGEMRTCDNLQLNIAL